jgi:UDP-N-acetylglucosamine 2-epimerase
VGTRPDAIKSAPVVLEFRRHADAVETFLVSTGQHREMLDQALAAFGISADRDLALMREGQPLAALTARALEGLDVCIEEYRPDVVLAQGDTTTTFCAGLAAFYRQVPFAHIEAGLRTPTVWSPFPEEFNRRAVGMTARWHFAPTRWAAANLIAEAADPATVVVTGNTGIDAVRIVAASQGGRAFADHSGRVVLLTTHRRENWGEPQAQVARAARRLLDAHPDVLLVVPMHKNPLVRQTLVGGLGGHPRARLLEPPDYAEFVGWMQRADLILSDSGGVQEEAPAFGVPVLVLRETTERPEGVEAGCARLVGTDEQAVFAAADRLLSDPGARAAMARTANPYGDGRASERICHAVLRDWGLEAPEVAPWT